VPQVPDYPPWELDPAYFAPAAAQRPAAAPEQLSPWGQQPPSVWSRPSAPSWNQAAAAPAWGEPLAAPAAHRAARTAPAASTAPATQRAARPMPAATPAAQRPARPAPAGQRPSGRHRKS